MNYRIQLKILLPAFATFFMMGCQEYVDTSNRYVFKYNTILDYLEKHPDTYSQYVQLLHQVPMSRISETTVAQILSARGNYTVFAPTNEAIHAYLDTLAAKNVIDESSWDGFRDSMTLDSIRKVIVYNSIIDGGDDHKAYETNSHWPTCTTANLLWNIAKTHLAVSG